MIYTVVMSDDDLFDAIEDRIKHLIEVHVDSMITEAIEEGMKDMKTLLKTELEGTYDRRNTL
jgi:hypothetical protein